MKNALILLTITCSALTVNAQFFYTVKSTPDSATVSVNGEKECVTPCRVKYYWRENKNKMIVFSVNAEGFDTWSDTISKKPTKFDKTVTVDLKPSVSKLTFDSINPLIAFDKLLVVFEDGQQVGSFTDDEGKTESIKWEGSVKLGNSSFEKIFYKRMTDYGFETPISENSKLFSGNENQKLLPRFVVGAQIVEYDVQVIEKDDKTFGAGKLAVRIRLKIEWKVLDKSTDNVAYTYTNEGVFHQRERSSTSGRDIAVNAFELALIDFAEKSDFYTLITSTKSPSIASKDIESNKPNVHLAKPNLPEFTKLSEMIQYASLSCVTVITDAGHGSGVIVSKNGQIITANHVVEGVNKIKVRLSSGIELDAKIVAFDSKKDVAFLKVEGSGFQALPFSLDKVGLGEEVIAIGTPADVDLGQSVSKGMISGNRAIEDQIILQIDISVSPGNSGGPILNSKGEVIGIVRSKIIGNGVEGIGFAIPIQSVIESLGIISEK